MARDLLKYLLLLVLFLWGFSVSIYYGRIGFMPLDHSIVFDGAWRVLCGQKPFLDFFTPIGLVPIYLQAMIFSFAGVSWLNYLIHAAILNSFFCLLVYGFLRLIGMSFTLSFFYAFLSGSIFYPPIGVPFPDQHAFFFLLLYLYLGMLISRTGNEFIRKGIIFFLPWIIGMSFFSKQNVAILGLPLLAIIIIKEKLFDKSFVLYFVCGVFAFIITVIIISYAMNINIAYMKYYVFDIPKRIGANRINKLSFIKRLISAALSTLMVKIYVTKKSYYVSTLFVSLYLCGFWLILTRNLRHNLMQYWFEAFIAFCLLLICIIFMAITKNQHANGMPFLFMSIGIFHYIILKILKKEKYSVKKLVACNFVILSFVIIDFLNFNLQINATRHVNDMYCKNESSYNNVYIPKMECVKWCFVFNISNEYLLNMQELINHMKDNPGHICIIGDTAVLYGILGYPSIIPTLYFEPDILPKINEEMRETLNEILKIKMKEYAVRYIIVEKSTHLKTPEEFILFYYVISDIIKSEVNKTYDFGWFKVYELIH